MKQRDESVSCVYTIRWQWRWLIRRRRGRMHTSAATCDVRVVFSSRSNIDILYSCLRHASLLYFYLHVLITLAGSSGKRNASVWRPFVRRSVCLIFFSNVSSARGAYSMWLISSMTAWLQHATWPAYISVWQ